MSIAVHTGCGGEVVDTERRMIETTYGFMDAEVNISPWCRKCGYKVHPKHITYTQISQVLSAEEGASIKARMDAEYDWLKTPKPDKI